MRPKQLVLQKMAGKEEDYKRLSDLGRELGVPVKKPGKYVKFSYTAHEKTLAEFRQVAERLHYPLQTAITEAMDCWIEIRTTSSKK